MRNKLFFRKLHSILSITLSLVMLIGACFVVPVATAVAEAEGTIIFDFDDNNAGMKVGDNTVENLRVSGGAFNLNVEKPDTAKSNILSINGAKGSDAHNHGEQRDLLFNNGSELIPLPAGTYQISYDYFVENRTVKETRGCANCVKFFDGTKYQHIKFVTLKKSTYDWSRGSNTNGALSDNLFNASVVSDTNKNASGSGEVTVVVSDEMVEEGANYLGLRISSLSYAVWLDNIEVKPVDDIPVTINFENHTLDGSGLFGIASLNGADGQPTNAFYASKLGFTMTEDRYTRIKNNGSVISLPAGTYIFECSYFITENATEYTDASVLQFAETSGISSDQNWINGSKIGKNIILPKSQKGEWIKSSQYISLPDGVNALGLFGIKTPLNIYLDDIKITKFEGFAEFNYSDGFVEVVGYTDNLTVPKDVAINFSHWENSKGEKVNVGDAVAMNETYTAVVSDYITYDFTDFKDTADAKKTDDGICVTVTPLTDNFVEVPVVNNDANAIFLNANTGYFVRATYQSMSDGHDEEGTGKAGYIRDSSSASKNGNWPEMLISNSDYGYAKGGIPFNDKAEFVTSGWTYIETSSATALKLKFSAREADLKEINIKSIEFIPVNLDDIKPTIGVEMLFNNTNNEVTLSSKTANSKLNGLKMPALSAVYNYEDTQRSLIRFVGSYASGGSANTLKINDDVDVGISNRRIRVAREGYTLNHYGFIDKNEKVVGSTAEISGNGLLNYWRKDGNDVDYSLALMNISKAKSDTTYCAQTYITIPVINGIESNSWKAEAGGFNNLLICSTVLKVSATEVYEALKAENSDITGWYTAE